MQRFSLCLCAFVSLCLTLSHNKSIKLCRLPARLYPFIDALHNPFLRNPAPEVSLVEVFSKDGFMHKLQFGKRKFLWQEFEADVRVIQFVANTEVRVCG